MGRDFLPSFLAGGCAGVCEISITFPLEFLKVNTQLGITDNNNAVKNNIKFKQVLNIVHNRCKQQGYIRTLYTGSPAWFLFAFPRSAIRFPAFEFANKQFKNKKSTSTQIICGAFSALIYSLTVSWLNPINAIVQNQMNLFQLYHHVPYERIHPSHQQFPFVKFLQ